MPPPDPQDDESPKATHRLTSMFVQEVSFVDVAANGETFLIAKRAYDMSAKLKKEDAASATAQVAAENEGAPATDTGEAGAMQAQVKEEITAALASIAEKIVSLATQADAAAVTDQPVTPAVPAPLTTQIADIAKEMAALAAKYGGPAAETVAASEGEGEKPAGAPAAPATKSEGEDDEKKEMTDAEKSAVAGAEREIAAKRLDPSKHADLVAKSVAARLSIRLDAAQAVVRKAGRRMAKERLERLGKAIDMLIGLLKELRYDSEKRAAKAAADRAAAQTKKSASPELSASEVFGLLDDTERVIKAHAAVSSELEKSANERATLKARVAELEKRTGPSNLLIPEPKPAPESPNGVYWGGDMNDHPAVKSALANKNRPATAR